MLAKLIDLSVARPPGPAPAGIGTLYYMAPEQARGGELGPADVWGIGAVLFEAATGEPAFDDPDAEELDDALSDTPSDVSDAPNEETDEPYESDDVPAGERLDESDYPQLSTTARRADEVRPLPPELADLIAACLQPLPERRPGVAELLQALEPIAGLPASERRFARPPG